MWIDAAILILLVITALAAISMRDLLAASILLAGYSLLMAVIWTYLNAVDVAFTEAAVGAGITTVLIIATLSRTKRREEPHSARRSVAGLLVSAAMAALLLYGSVDMPAFGDPAAPANRYVAQYYIEHSEEEAGVANVVTAVLASYRGYDTLGETTVIFTAGAAVILLLRRRRSSDG